MVNDGEVAAGVGGFIVFDEASGVGEFGIAEGEIGAAIGVEFFVEAVDLRGLVGEFCIESGGFDGGGAEGAPDILSSDFGEDLVVVGLRGELFVDGLADEVERGLFFVAEEDGGVVFEGVCGVELAADAAPGGCGRGRGRKGRDGCRFHDERSLPGVL